MDSLGRYTLSEMQARIRRELGDAQLTVNTSTGAESASAVYPSQLYSNTDLTEALNYSMMNAFLEMCVDHEDIFAQTTYITISANRAIYALPFNMIKLRWLKIKPSSYSLSQIRPDQWQPMVYWDEDLSSGVQNEFAGSDKTYRREGDNIVLNWIPNENNSNGIMVNSVNLPPELVNSTDVVQSQFARPLQNFMIYDAAAHIGDTRESQVPPELKEQRERAHTLLMANVDNALQPPTVQLYSGRLVKTTYSGRR